MDATTRYRLLQVSLVLLSSLIAFAGVFIVLFLFNYEPSEEADVESIAMLVNGSLISWIVGIPLLIIVIIKRRKSELTTPTRFTKLYYRHREAHQCTICQKHQFQKNIILKTNTK